MQLLRLWRNDLINIVPISEWIGDVDGDNSGRIGLWQVCQKDEISDNCHGQLEEVLAMPSLPFQVIDYWVGGMEYL